MGLDLTTDRTSNLDQAWAIITVAGKKVRAPITVTIESPGAAGVTGDLASMGYVKMTSEHLLGCCGLLDIPAGATRAHVQSNGGSGVRWRDDGVDPTALVGMRLNSDDERLFAGDLSALRFVDQGANAVLDITYYG